MLRSIPLLPLAGNRPRCSTLPAHIRHSGEHLLSLAFAVALSAAPPCVAAQTDQPSGSGQQANPQGQICDVSKQSDSHKLSLGIAKSQSLDDGSSVAEQQSGAPAPTEWRSRNVGLPQVQPASSAQQEQAPICKKTGNAGAPVRPADPTPPASRVEAPEPDPITNAALLSYANGKLTIDAQNVSLHEVIEAIRARFGVAVDYPAEPLDERVFEHVGPMPVRDALSQLLYGSRFNYIIQTSSQDPELVTRLILSAQSRVLASAKSPQPPNQPIADQADNQVSAGEVGSNNDSPPQPVQPTRPALTPSALDGMGIPSGFNVQQAAAAAGKTTGQILEELQKRQIQMLNDQAPQP